MPRVHIRAEDELGGGVEAVRAVAEPPHSKVEAGRRNLRQARASIVARWRERQQN